MERARRRRWRRILLGAGVLLVTALFALPLYLAGARTTPVVEGREIPSSSTEGDTLRVMTLNLAHGRGDGPNQCLRRGSTFRTNLRAAAAVLSRAAPHAVALQEADGPSLWSGRFDHVAFLAGEAGFPCRVRGEHVRGLGLSYGTAILSTSPLREPLSVAFRPSPPTLAKGFVKATMPFPDGRGEVDIISVHLDFSRRSVREAQVGEMVRDLSPRRAPLVVMGDFNCGWEDADSPLRTLSERLDLRAFRPELKAMTFPCLGRRLDWILVSPELAFASYDVLPDIVSDHLAVVADLRRAETP